MPWKTILPLCLALLSIGCHSAPPPQPADASGDTVVMLRESVGEERTANVGEAILGVAKTQDGQKSTGVELFYLGLTDQGRIKLRVVPADPAQNETWRRRLREAGYVTSGSGPVEIDQDPQETFVADDVTVEFLEAQASWVRYRLTL